MKNEDPSSGAPEQLDRVVHAARNGDASALGRLLNVIRPHLKNSIEAQIRWPLTQKLDASDLAQEALVSAVRGFDGFRGRTWREFAAWATRIARMEALKAQRHWTLAMRDMRRERPADDSNLAEPHEAPTQVHVAEWRDTAAQIWKLVDSLPSHLRVVVQLRYCEGLSIKELAERLGRTTDAIVGMLRRGLDFLRQLADQEGIEHEGQ